MRHLFLLLLFLPSSVFAQTKKDYELAVSRFMQFYNAGQADSIQNMFSDEWGEMKASLWKEDDLKEAKDEYGKMLSYKYAGIDEDDPAKVHVFKVEFESSTHAMSLTLNSDRHLGTFRFHTTSTNLRKMLKDVK